MTQITRVLCTVLCLALSWPAAAGLLKPSERRFLDAWESRPFDLEQKRRDGIGAIWPGQETLAEDLPAVEGQYLVTRMPHGFVSRSKVFDSTNGQWIIFVQGHQPVGWITEQAIIDFFRAQGFGVIAMTMPATGENRWKRRIMGNAGEIKMNCSPTCMHDRMGRYLGRPGFSPQAFYFQPVLEAVNWLHPRASRIHMTGVSGGAWTTVVYAALDPRIVKSACVAGCLPLFVMNRLQVGDWEYRDPQLTGAMNYLDMAVMGSCEAGREQLQVHHRHEQWLNGPWPRTYAPYLRRVVARECAGTWHLLMNERKRQVHEYSRIAAKAFAALLQR